MLRAFDDVPWQMDEGERAALEGLLCQIRPELAIEVGTDQGGSLRASAKYIGVMVIGAGGSSKALSACGDDGIYSMYELVAPVRDALVAQERRRELAGPSRVRDALAAAWSSEDEVSRLRAELAALRQDLGILANSRSWRLTAPLRAAAAVMRNGRP